MIVAILIGRKGSGGLPGKNTQLIAGRPMVWWPLDVVQQVTEVGRTYVSTDDPNIADIAQSFDAKLIERPPHLATAESLGEEVFVHAHQAVGADAAEDGFKVEMYVLLMANAITISPQQIREGIQVLQKDTSVDAAVTVSCYNMWSPLRARRIAEDGLLQPFVPFETFGDPETLNCDRDSQGDVWFADMGVSVIRPRNLDNLDNGLLPQKWMGRRIYPIKNSAGLDVDYDFQVPQVEWWLQQFR